MDPGPGYMYDKVPYNILGTDCIKCHENFRFLSCSKPLPRLNFERGHMKESLSGGICKECMEQVDQFNNFNHNHSHIFEWPC